ncbi:MAG: 16S rRNA (guanine(527)-N(7))-methyltransferase RsmG [Clostridia bacterium]|nr:16S rRNA (guanine(527)-N(7))-methyltransferase RsmG [Clostridia bacterium]
MIDLPSFEALFREIFTNNKLDRYITENHIAKFHTLACELERVNAEMNLTAIRDPAEVIAKHFADSVLCADAIPEGARIIDVGCGGGFPTLPLGIARDDLAITGLDSTAKKLGFVQSTADLLGLRVKTLNMRAEAAGQDVKYREKFDCAVARAVARLNILLELCLPLVKVGGHFVALKAAAGREELAEAKDAIHTLGGKLIDSRDISLICGDEVQGRQLFIIEKVRPCDKKHPRNYAQISKKPL